MSKSALQVSSFILIFVMTLFFYQVGFRDPSYVLGMCAFVLVCVFAYKEESFILLFKFVLNPTDYGVNMNGREAFLFKDHILRILTAFGLVSIGPCAFIIGAFFFLWWQIIILMIVCLFYVGMYHVNVDLLVRSIVFEELKEGSSLFNNAVNGDPAYLELLDIPREALPPIAFNKNQPL